MKYFVLMSKKNLLVFLIEGEEIHQVFDFHHIRTQTFFEKTNKQTKNENLHPCRWVVLTKKITFCCRLPHLSSLHLPFFCHSRNIERWRIVHQTTQGSRWQTIPSPSSHFRSLRHDAVRFSFFSSCRCIRLIIFSPTRRDSFALAQHQTILLINTSAFHNKFLTSISRHSDSTSEMLVPDPFVDFVGVDDGPTHCLIQTSSGNAGHKLSSFEEVTSFLLHLLQHHKKRVRRLGFIIEHMFDAFTTTTGY